MDDPNAVGRISVWKAAVALFTSAEEFANVNRQHSEFGKRQAELAMAPRPAGVPHVSSPEGIKLSALRAVVDVRKATLLTLAISAAVLLLASMVAFWWGALNPSLPWHWGKVFQTAGAAFALWGTLLALSGPQRSWGGGTAAELAHGLVFTVILAIGGALAMFGTLISP